MVFMLVVGLFFGAVATHVIFKESDKHQIEPQSEYNVHSVAVDDVKEQSSGKNNGAFIRVEANGYVTSINTRLQQTTKNCPLNFSCNVSVTQDSMSISISSSKDRQEEKWDGETARPSAFADTLPPISLAEPVGPSASVKNDPPSTFLEPVRPIVETARQNPFADTARLTAVVETAHPGVYPQYSAIGNLFQYAIKIPYCV